MSFHMQPWMLLALLPLSIGFEGAKFWDSIDYIAAMDANSLILWTFKLTAAAFIAFIMELSEFLTLSYTSSLSLSMVNTVKEICQLFLAVEINHDEMTPINVFGLVLCMCGIVVHVVSKYQKYNHEKVDSQPTISYELFKHRTEGGGNRRPNHISQQAPLLESDALDYSSSDTDSQAENGSNVIFDVLNRRTTQR